MGNREQRIEVELVQGARMVAKVGDHRVTIDLAEEQGGGDTAPTPTELFMASIAACKLYNAYKFLNRRKKATDGTKASIAWESNDKAIEVARVNVEVPGGVEEAHVKGCIRMMQTCFVAASIKAGMKIEATVD